MTASGAPTNAPLSYSTLLGAVDAAIGRDHDGDARYVPAATFAAVWAAVGYVVWIVLVLAARVVASLARLVASPWRRRRDDDDDRWTTTMKRRGRVR